MNVTLSKNIILYFLVLLWIVFSLGYIINDLWSDFKNVQISQAYQRARTEIINQLIQEAEKCQPFSVFSGEKKIKLIKVDCLEKK